MSIAMGNKLMGTVNFTRREEQVRCARGLFFFSCL